MCAVANRSMVGRVLPKQHAPMRHRRGISGAFLLFSDVFHTKLTMPQNPVARRNRKRLSGDSPRAVTAA
jgi:hypothetical protein